jgi:hypothetical protein
MSLAQASLVSNETLQCRLALGQYWRRFGDTYFLHLQGRSVAAMDEEMLPKPSYFNIATYTDCWPLYHDLSGPTKGLFDSVTLSTVPSSPDGAPSPLYPAASVGSKTYIHMNTQPSYSLQSWRRRRNVPLKRRQYYRYPRGARRQSRINTRNRNESLASV